jgi:MFS family permease
VARLTWLTWGIYSYSNVFFLFGPYLEARGFSSGDAGLLVGAFYAATTLIRPIGGWIAERAGIRRALIASALVCLVAALLKFAADSFWPLLLIRLAMGSAFGVFVVGLTAYQSLSVPDESRGRAFALVTLGSLSCLFTVVPLADWLLRNGHPSLFLAVPLCAAVLCAALPARLPPLRGQAREGDWGTWRDLYRETPFWRVVASCVLFGLCDASIVCLPALVLAMKLVPTSFVVANGLGALLMRTFGMTFFNRHPRVVFAGPSLLLMAVFLYLTAAASSNLWIFVCGFFYGVGMGYGYPAHLALTGDLAPARLRAKASALVHFCNDSGWFLLPLYVGFAVPLIGERPAFQLLAVFSAVSGVGVTLMWAAYGASRGQRPDGKTFR